MVLGFIHDHIFYQENGITFSGGGLPSTTWSRYLTVSDKIKVFGRLGEKKLKVVSSFENVEFYFSIYYKNPKDLLTKYYKIERELKSFINKCDFMIIRLPSVLGMISAKICNKIEKPYILEIVGSAKESMMYSGLKGKIFGTIMESKMKSMVSKSSFIIYVTKNYLQEIYPSSGKSINISNVYLKDSNEFILENRLEKIKKLNNNEPFRIGLVGALNVPYKGHEILIKAIENLNLSNRKVLINFIGGGQSENIQKKIDDLNLSEVIKIRGSLRSGLEMMNFLDEIDLLIHPSLTEGLPRIVLEAFSRGCPVLASNAGGIPELLDENYLHDRGDYIKLRDQLDDIIFNKNILKLMAKNNYIKSIEYSENILQEKRKKFIIEFLEDYETKQNKDF